MSGKAMKIFDYFDRVALINLPSRKDRLKAVSQELQNAGISLSDGRFQVFEAIKPDDSRGFPSVGWRGCFLSHLSIIKSANQDGMGNVLIFEDDVLISRKFAQQQELLVDVLRQNNWDFAYFGHVINVEKRKVPKFVAYSEQIITTHCYAINGRVFDRLIKYLEEYGEQVAIQRPDVDHGIDGILSMFRESNKDIVSLISVPSLVTQNDSPSDIHHGVSDIKSVFSFLNSLPFGNKILKSLRVVKRFFFDV
jgi:glycosyl transferase, family 25